MSSSNYGLLELFPEIKTKGQFSGFFQNTKITCINTYTKSKRIEIILSSEKLIPAAVIEAVEQELISAFKLGSVKIKIKYELKMSAEEIISQYRNSIEYMINCRAAMSKGLLNDSEWEVSGKKIRISLKTVGAAFLKTKGCDSIIEEIFSVWFGLQVKVEFYDIEIDECTREEYLRHKETEEEKLIGGLVSGVEIQRDTVQKDSNGNGKAEKNKDKKDRQSGKDDVILGKNFTDELVSMCNINQDSGKIAFEGQIFSFDSRDIKNGKKLIMFDATDFTSSLTIKFFCKGDDFDLFSARLKNGVWIKVRGEAQYDKFSRELGIMASDIVEIYKQSKKDEAEVKRVELHLHTQLSQMDGVSSASDIIKRAANWGHSSIAITDHGVVQAYPEAYDAGKKNNVRIIYGMECYLLDDSVPVVYRAKEYPLDGEFVVLDIETTGLNYESDRITEIGAVKIRNGEITDRFNTFVNPEIPIPENITKLTGITNEMTVDAPLTDEALKNFLDFAGELPLVAHNALFDLGFVRYNARKIDINVDNPVVDTLQLCRLMFPRLSKYKLDAVANHLGFKIDKYHRAVEDSAAAARIFAKCLEILKNKGVTSIDRMQDSLEGAKDFTKMPNYHAVILVKNFTGLKNMYILVSKSHLEYYHKKPRIPKSLLMAHREGLILGTACEAGELYTALLENRDENEITRIVRFYDYLEIQPLGNNRFLVDSGKVKDEEGLKNLNRRIVTLGEKHKKLVVATCDVHFLDPGDEVYRRILMAGQGYSDADNQAPLHFRTTEEMLREFDYLGKEKAYEVVVENTNGIAEQIEHILPIPEETFPPKIEGSEEDIRRLAEGKAREIYGDPLPEVVEKRLVKELNSIIKNGFSVMYIIAQKLVWKSLSDGYLVGSRGSVGSSFAATMAGITEVNPLPPHYVCKKCKYSEFILDGSIGCGVDMEDKDCPRCGEQLMKDGYDIPFETFLGFDGDKEPDIDLNFSGTYQSVAHKYTEELFGEGHVFRAGTIGTIAEKTAYGFVKNYLDEKGIPATNAEINRLVKGCSGVKRTTGQHPGGVMIVPQDKEIYEFCPIQRPADDIESNITTTHFDYHSISGRLLKLDILGHDDPTVIRMLEDLTGVNAREIPIGEKKTMGIFSSADPIELSPDDINSPVATFAIPEFGTKFVRQMLVDTKPTTFSELIRISGLSHGTDVWLNNAQDLVRAGTAKLSEVICTRDDIMVYLIYKALSPKTAFKIMEDVRKGKGLKDEYVEVMKSKRVPEWYIESCKKIKYMFPKAHAAAYVMMAFRIAWFKVYYPEAFYVTYFTVRADEFDAELMTHGQDRIKRAIRDLEAKGNNATQKEKNVLTILEVANEMYARGIFFLPVNLYKSDAVKFQITHDGIRPPLNTLQGLGAAAAQNIVEARADGKFLSIDDLRIRAKVSKSVIEILQQHGCLDGLDESNQISLF